MESPAPGRPQDTGQRPTVLRRVAAAVALISPVIAVGSVVSGLLQDPAGPLLALLLTLGAVLAGWAALIHRGRARVIATVIAAALLLGLAALLVLDSFWRLVVLVGLVLLSTAAARVAFGRSAASALAETYDVEPARHGVLIMNRWSGGGKVERFDLPAQARRRGVMPIMLERGDDLRALAEQAVADGADVIGMAGGDGSQALVADVASRHDVGFVCVPAGTRNHLALDLGLNRADVVAALDAYGAAVERRVDLARLGDRTFVNNASIGAYASIVQSESYRNAKLSTIVATLPDLIGPDAAWLDLRYPGPDGGPRTRADVLLVSNNAYRLESLPGFGTRERMDRGVLGIATLVARRTGDPVKPASPEAGGGGPDSPGYRTWTAPEFVVESADPLIDVGLDGEALRLPPPLHFRTVPGALRVRIPADAPGLAPAARSPSLGAAAGALVRVLAGRPG